MNAGVTLHFKAVFVLGCVFCAVLGACLSPAPPVDYFPVSASRQWYYRLEKTTMDGTIEQRYALHGMSDGAGRQRLVTADGNVHYFQRTDSWILHTASRPNGASAVRYVEPPVPVLPLQPRPGVVWSTHTETQVLEKTGPPQATLFRIAVRVPITLSIKSASETVSVPAGEFTDCVHVSGSGQTTADAGNYIGRTEITVATEDWYAPGVGLIKRVRHERTTHPALNHGTQLMELLSYAR